VGELHITLEGLRESAKGLACEVLDRNDLDLRLTERLLFLVRLLTQWWEQFEPLRERLGENPDFPLGILLKDARLLHVNSGLYELQTARISEELLKRVAVEESM
jgi:hypothetical protein